MESVGNVAESVGWRFPVNDGGVEEGFSDSGIETYRGSVYENLARETIQNSMDAADRATGKPVRVTFELLEIASALFPGRDELLQAVERCRERYRHGRQNAFRFFDRALGVLRQPTIPFLRVSDYNTTGLTGADNDNPHESNWASLVKAVGVSNKPEGSGGSFGIGKHAPYACSNLRCVFYSTRASDGLTAFQGVAKLATHVDLNGRLTRGTGFYGRLTDCGPLLDPSLIDPVFRRSEVGTDLFIAGFKNVEGWEGQIVRSVLDNFFVAIHQGRLVVDVQGLRIDAESFPALLERYIDAKSLTRGYYRALVSPEARVFEEGNFEGLGRVRLYLHQDPNYVQKAIAMVRATGMKVFPKTTHPRVPVRFVGVLIADGDGINKLLQSMEPPEHHKWDPNLLDDERDRKYASRVKEQLYEWINENIKSLVPSSDADEIEIEGVGELLADESMISQETPDTRSSTVMAKAGPVVVAELDSPRTRAHRDNEDTDQESDTGRLRPRQADEPGGGVLRERRRSRKSQPPRSRSVSLRAERIFCADPNRGHYVVQFTPDVSGTAYMSVFVEGEDDSHPARIASARDEVTGRNLPVLDGQPNTVGPIHVSSKERIRILVVLEEPLRVALEAILHAS